MLETLRGCQKFEMVEKQWKSVEQMVGAALNFLFFQVLVWAGGKGPAGSWSLEASFEKNKIV